MARAGDEIVVVKDVPALICDTCGEVEYTLETSREIDAIMKDFFAGRLLAKPLAAGRSHPSHSGLARRDEMPVKIYSADEAGEDPKGKSRQAEPGRRG